MIAALPACLLGAGATTFAAGSARPRDISLKPLGLMLPAADLGQATGFGGARDGGRMMEQVMLSSDRTCGDGSTRAKARLLR